MMLDSWHSYPKVYTLGHAALKEIFLDDVIVEEKIDGSQFSFGMFNGEILTRSKSAVFPAEHPEEMFTKAVETVVGLRSLLHEGWTYRAEYLQKPHHSGLTYKRVPDHYIIIFDINKGLEDYLPYDEKFDEAQRLGLEVVPLLHHGRIESAQDIRHLLERESILGGSLIEGVVVKNYKRFSLDGHAMLGKFVSEAAKEVINKAFRKANPTNQDIIDLLGQSYGTQMRWHKAVAHLRDEGKLENSPRDIGLLIKEIPNDVFSECELEIKDQLFNWAWPKIRRLITHGMPEWYKQLLLDKQFEDGNNI